MPLGRSDVERRPATIVPVRLIQPSVEQQLDQLGAALLRRAAQHRPPVAVNHVDVRAPKEEEPDDGGVAHADRALEGGPTGAVRVINVRFAGFKEQFADLCVT